MEPNTRSINIVLYTAISPSNQGILKFYLEMFFSEKGGREKKQRLEGF